MMFRAFTRIRARRGFTLNELLVVLTVAGVLSAMSMGRIHDVIIQQRISRAATTVQSDLEAAFDIAGRNRQPVDISWSPSSLQIAVTSRDGTTAFRHTYLGSTAYSLTSSNVSVSRSSIEVYPNGLASDTLVVTFTSPSSTKSVRMSRAGLVRIQ